MNELMKNLSKALDPKVKDYEEVVAEDAPKKVKFKKKLRRKKRRDGDNEQARKLVSKGAKPYEDQ